MLGLWLDTYQLQQARYRGNGPARKFHSSRDYTRLAEPILIEIQQREQDILEYLSSGLEQPLAS